MAAPKRRWTGQCEYPLTDEYRAGHVATFGSKLDRYCDGCGRLPAWCCCTEMRDRAVAKATQGQQVQDDHPDLWR
jgi:hypothetical protein